MACISKLCLTTTIIGIVLSIVVSPAAAQKNSSLFAWNDLEV